MKYLMKTVNAVIAAAIFPVILFLDFIFIQLGTNENAQPLFEQISPGTPGVGIEESFSIFDMIQIARGEHIYSDLFDSMGATGPFEWPEAFAPINGRLIAFAVFLVLCVAFAIFIIVWSICSSKKLPVVIAAVGGIISAIIMISCFNSAASVLVSGEISISSLFDGGWLSSLLLGFVGIDTLMLAGFHSGIIIIFVCILVWTGAFALIEIGDKEEEAKTKKK